MKILISTPVIPTKKNKLINYVENINKVLKTKTHTELIWLVFQPDKIDPQGNDEMSILNIHDFNDSVDILRKIRPDCVLTNNNSREPISYSLSLASNFLNIPLVYYYLNDLAPILGHVPNVNFKRNASSMLRRFFSNKLPADSETEKKVMKRGRFFIYKNRFLVKTKRSLGINFIGIMRFLIKDLISYFRYKKPVWTNLSDLNLIPNQNWHDFLLSLGLDKTKIAITGSPFWDTIYQKVKLREEKRLNIKKEGIKVLIITGSLAEHGIWTYKQRDKYLKRIFYELQKDKQISFSLKIHPASENKLFYKSFLEKLNISAKIFQHENLWDIIDEYDVVLSYSSSTVHTECAVGGIKTVLLDVGWSFRMAALVEEAITSGHFIKCNRFEDILPSIYRLYQKEVRFNDEFLRAQERMTFRFDGKAGERATNAILQVCKKNINT